MITFVRESSRDLTLLDLWRTLHILSNWRICGIITTRKSQATTDASKKESVR